MEAKLSKVGSVEVGEGIGANPLGSISVKVGLEEMTQKSESQALFRKKIWRSLLRAGELRDSRAAEGEWRPLLPLSRLWAAWLNFLPSTQQVFLSLSHPCHRGSCDGSKK